MGQDAAPRQHADELAALNSLSRAVSAPLALTETIRAALGGMMHAVHPDLAFLFLRDGDKLSLQHILPATAVERLGAIPEHRVGECLCGLAVREKQPLYARDICNDHRCTWEECKRAGFKSFAALPLMSGAEVIGVVGLASGTERDFEQQGAFLETLAGQISIALANARLHDINRRELADRQRIEAALQAESAFRNSIVESANVGMCVCHEIPDFPYVNFTVWNSSMTEITGYSVEEINRRGWYQSVYPDPEVQARASARMARMRTGDNLRGEEWEITRSDGTKRVVGISTAIVRRGADEVHVFALMHDLTQRKRVEEALRESERKYKSLIETTNTGYVIIDAAGRVVDANQEYVRLTGHRELTEILGRSVTEWTAPHDLERNAAEVKRCFAAGQVRNLEIDYVDQTGRFQPIEINATVLRTPEGASILTLCRDITERKRAEEALRESTVRLREIIEHAPFGAHSYELHADGRLLLAGANQSADLILGINHQPLLGRTIEEAFPGLRETDIPDAYRRLAASEGRLERGQVIYEEGQIKGAFYIHAFHTGPNRMTVFFRDITERQKAEDALRKSEALYHDLVETSQDLIWQCDTEGRYTYLNPAWEVVFGYRLQEMLGRPFADFQSPEHAARDLAQFARLLGGGTVKGYETIHRRKDGAEIHLVFNAKFIRDADGKIAGTRGTAYDITERKQAAQRQLLRAEILGILHEDLNLPDAIHRILAEIKRTTGFDAVGLRLRQDGDFPYFQQHGFSHDFMLAENCLAVRAPEGGVCRNADGSNRLECTCGLVLSGRADLTNPFFTPRGSFWSNDMRPLLQLPLDQDPRLHPRNRCIHEGFQSVALIPIRANQEIVGLLQLNARRQHAFTLELIRFFEEISATLGVTLMRKQAEEDKERLQAQLNQAQKMESVGRLAGGVAHDFNNMLQAILGNTDLILQDFPRDSSVRESLEEIRKSAQRSADLTRQLLAFARKQTISPQVLDLNDTVGGMLKMLRRLIGENIDLAWLPGAALWPVKVDPSQIDQILANLCVNARDAIGGVGKVTIGTVNATLDGAFAANHPECAPGDYVQLAISDTGSGMDAETKAHLFEPFFTTKEVGEGTGLGLATVYGIVKQNGGSIDVFSEPGQGTTFRIYLPRAEAQAVVAAHEVARRSLHGNETVLLVEDEEQVLLLTQRILRQHGYTVLAARTPEAALQLAESHAGPIHLLVTDVVMPGMNGKELHERLHAGHPGMKCLFMSGYTAEVIASHGVLETGVEFLQKPFTIQTLAEKVRETLQRASRTG